MGAGASTGDVGKLSSLISDDAAIDKATLTSFGNVSILDKFDAIADPSTQTISKQQLVGLLREGEPSAAAAAADDDEDLGEFEVIVIGGGPTGVTAALRAAYLGRKALLIDKCDEPVYVDPTTGVDRSFGAPTGLFSKALRDTAKHLDVTSLRSMGVADEVIWQQVTKSCMDLASHNANHQLEQLRAFKIALAQGWATLGAREGEGDAATYTVHVARGAGGSARARSARVLLATGSKPTPVPGITFDHRRVFDSDSIVKLGFLPRSLAIVGAGIVAIEFARIFQLLGARVTLLVRGDVLSGLAKVGLDPDVAAMLKAVLVDAGIDIREGTTIAELAVPPAESGAGARAPIRIALSTKGAAEPPPPLEVDALMAAAGRAPATERCGLAAAGVALGKRGHVDLADAATFASSAPGVFAAGDVLPPPSPALASTGMEQGALAVAAMLGEAPPADGARGASANFPCGMWTVPEASYYGLTLAKARERGLACDEGVARFEDCLRGRVFAPRGLLKLVFETGTGRVVGVHIVGDDAAEMIHYGMLLVQSGATLGSVITTVYVAVTYHELFKVAALDGNAKLEFGLQWQTILAGLGASGPAMLEAVESGALAAEFAKLDADGSGELSPDELGTCLRANGTNVTTGLLANLIRLADADGSGAISYAEFERVIRKAAGAGAGATY